MRNTNYKSSSNNEGTIIGAGVRLTGTLFDEKPISIFGHTKGEIGSSESIFIGESAEIDGPMTANIITISGLVKGKIIAKDRLEITQTGRVIGSIEAQTLMIHPGAKFTGECKMENPRVPEKQHIKKEEIAAIGAELED
jgi:cytoskeletal protein CcmA (bactofilin family)